MFAQISPKLPEKVLGHISYDFHVIWVPFFQIKLCWAPFLSNQSTLGAIFARNFYGLCPDFQRFF